MTCLSHWPGSWGEHVVQRYLECTACMGHTTVEHIPDDKKRQKAWYWRSTCMCVHQTWSHLKAKGSSHIYQKLNTHGFAASIPQSFLRGAKKNSSFNSFINYFGLSCAWKREQIAVIWRVWQPNFQTSWEFPKESFNLVHRAYFPQLSEENEPCKRGRVAWEIVAFFPLK